MVGVGVGAIHGELSVIWIYNMILLWDLIIISGDGCGAWKAVVYSVVNY